MVIPDLSPAAQAVLNEFTYAACGPTYEVRKGIAAALRAAADEAAKSDPTGDAVEDWIRRDEREHMRGKMHAIAAELEGQSDA